MDNAVTVRKACLDDPDVIVEFIAEEARESEGRSAIRKLNNNRRILSCANKRH